MRGCREKCENVREKNTTVSRPSRGAAGVLPQQYPVFFEPSAPSLQRSLAAQSLRSASPVVNRIQQCSVSIAYYTNPAWVIMPPSFKGAIHASAINISALGLRLQQTARFVLASLLLVPSARVCRKYPAPKLLQKTRHISTPSPVLQWQQVIASPAQPQLIAYKEQHPTAAVCPGSR